MYERIFIHISCIRDGNLKTVIFVNIVFEAGNLALVKKQPSFMFKFGYLHVYHDLVIRKDNMDNLL